MVDCLVPQGGDDARVELLTHRGIAGFLNDLVLAHLADDANDGTDDHFLAGIGHHADGSGERHALKRVFRGHDGENQRGIDRAEFARWVHHVIGAHGVGPRLHRDDRSFAGV